MDSGKKSQGVQAASPRIRMKCVDPDSIGDQDIVCLATYDRFQRLRRIGCSR